MYHPLSERIVDLLVTRTSTTDRHFFRLMTAFYMGVVSSMMRAHLRTQDRGDIPINCYSACLSTSGSGKNYASNSLEDIILMPFKTPFLADIMYPEARNTVTRLAVEESRKSGEDPDVIKETLGKEFYAIGEYALTFDSATSAAVRQQRRKLQLAGAGALNLIIDEVGDNLIRNYESLTDYLSLYDKGILKQKITKHTAESKRGIELDCPTPANLLMFGTPSKVLDGTTTEEQFFTLLETGFARRMLFGFNPTVNKVAGLTPEELFEMACKSNSVMATNEMSAVFIDLAKPEHFHKFIRVPRELSIKFIEYRMKCEEMALDMPDHQEIQKTELSHRYFKAMKLAGTYAFIDGVTTMTEDHLNYAIKLVEDSGLAFANLVNRERPYVKLAKYIADQQVEITRADLVEDLPCFTGSEAAKRELLDLAVAYGYNNNIIIKREFRDGIEFISGDRLEETNLDEIIFSASMEMAFNYENLVQPFDKLHMLLQQPNMHFTTHHVKNGHRSETNCIAGFNMVAIDVDSGVTVQTAKKMLEGYKYILYTTKRHLVEDEGICVERFRILFPLSHVIKLSSSDFKEFMDNLFDWLPFESDYQTSQRSRKWLTHNSVESGGEYFENDGELLDSTLFIPMTRKSEELRAEISGNSNITNLERWFFSQAVKGNRNNTLARYAFVLLDKGHSESDIVKHVKEFNKRLPNPLAVDELDNTILKSIGKKVTERE